MKKKKLLFALLLTIGAAGAAKATKARDFLGYINYLGAWRQVYVPFECPFIGYGCTYLAYDGTTYQVYSKTGLLYTPLRP